jgi:hypothetical protein
VPAHVFVLRGDLTQLACDAWLVPGDFTPGDSWMTALEAHEPSHPPRWGEAGGPRVLPWPAKRRGERTPDAFLTFLAGNNRDGPEWYVDGARAFVRAAAPHVHARGAPFHGRTKHLLGVPLVGTGFGGGQGMSGDVARMLLRALREEADAHDVDIALVLRDGPAFAAAQNERMQEEDEAFAALDPAHRTRADELADRATAGDLVVFVGAGVSQGAGLPSWHRLLQSFAAKRAGITGEHEQSALSRLGELDRAAIIQARLGDDTAIGDQIALDLEERSTHYALGHGLLASLPLSEVITTNYDQLFERASSAAGRPVTVLPEAPTVRGQRWLLKMHGCVSRPESIVLTREDYLRFEQNRSALAGIVQALLMTRHMLFVGFSFTDDNFHRIAHAVRQSLASSEGMRSKRFGTTLVVNPNPLAHELWADDVEWTTFPADADEALDRIMQQARGVDIFLDRMAARASTTASHLMDPRYEAVLSDAEKELRDRLQQLARDVGPEVRATRAWAEVDRLLKSLGYGWVSSTPPRSYSSGLVTSTLPAADDE